MLEPESNYPKYQPGAFDDAGEPTNFSPNNRRDLAISSGWMLFLSIISGLGVVFSLVSLTGISNMYGQEATIFLIMTLVSVSVNIAILYWYVIYFQNARAIGQGSNQAVHAQKMTSAVLAMFRLWGILIIVFLLFYLLIILFAAGGGFGAF